MFFGEQMAKEIKGTYVEKALIKSDAFAQLTGAAPRLLLLFLLRRKMGRTGRKGHERWICQNNGQIVFSWSEAKKRYGLSLARFGRALDQLVKYGFIDIEHAGGGCEGDASLYAISDRWRDYGTGKFIKKTRPKDKRQIGWRKKKQ